jgi:hypothetical protein
MYGKMKWPSMTRVSGFQSRARLPVFKDIYGEKGHLWASGRRVIRFATGENADRKSGGSFFDVTYGPRPPLTAPRAYRCVSGTPHGKRASMGGRSSMATNVIYAAGRHLWGDVIYGTKRHLWERRHLWRRASSPAFCKSNDRKITVMAATR